MKVDISNPYRYEIDEEFIQKKLTSFLIANHKGLAQVEIVFVNIPEMKRLGKLYLKETERPAHNVLSFTNSESLADFVFPPGGGDRLGEIIICYPVAEVEARGEGVEVGEKIYELVEHGARHLLGQHHK